MIARRRFLLLTLLLSLLAAADAHHSMDLRDATPIRIEGDIEFVSWDGAHVVYDVRGIDADGELRTWAIMCASPKILRSRGITQTTFKVGDRITVTGFLIHMRASSRRTSSSPQLQHSTRWACIRCRCRGDSQGACLALRHPRSPAPFSAPLRHPPDAGIQTRFLAVDPRVHDMTTKKLTVSNHTDTNFAFARSLRTSPARNTCPFIAMYTPAAAL